MSKNTSERNIEHWKQKYYDHLDLLDKKEKSWQKTESALKKTVQRLSIAAEGQHTTMDLHLHDVRSMMKKQLNLNLLENRLEDISAVLLKMADEQTREDKKVTSALSILLQNIHLPDSSSKNKNRLLNKLSKSSDKDSDELAQQVQQLLSTAIKQPDNDELTPPKPGLLNNLISLFYRDTAYEKSGEQAIGAVNEPTAQELLLCLLEELTIPADLHEEFAGLKAQLEKNNSDASWKSLLKDVASLINTLRSRLQQEKHEFENFLQQVTSRLREMDHVLSTGNTALTEAEQASGAFDAAVNAQVRDIHDDMSTADNLDDLKSKVEKRLNVVSEHIREYRTNEQARYSNAQQNSEEMRSRLMQLERESSDLKVLIQEKNKEAMIDVLTEIPNRLSYEKKAVEEIARCNRFSTPLSMAVWDIDLFKQVNDTYGHKVGDKMLKAVAQLLQERMRETDFIARYGGEEFVMFLPGADETEALKLADALREKIASCKFHNHGEVIKITVSCGVSSFMKDDSHEAMFERADTALYAAKRNGRNQCISSDS